MKTPQPVTVHHSMKSLKLKKSHLCLPPPNNGGASSTVVATREQASACVAVRPHADCEACGVGASIFCPDFRKQRRRMLHAHLRCRILDA
ncbi:hypothetical protein V5799_006045 [Amblyomma americanum]|uniref:Uncharacterized protein n=1 Tax=Amblyomma americanum TaxID=6943 RepID=A0AAQ4DXH9_AMBAM